MFRIKKKNCKKSRHKEFAFLKNFIYIKLCLNSNRLERKKYSLENILSQSNFIACPVHGFDYGIKKILHYFRKVIFYHYLITIQNKPDHTKIKNTDSTNYYIIRSLYFAYGIFQAKEKLQSNA